MADNISSSPELLPLENERIHVAYQDYFKMINDFFSSEYVL
jgi:hypothetical protein